MKTHNGPFRWNQRILKEVMIMFRTTRYFDKNDGKHNFYGELEYVEDWDAGPDDEVTEKKPKDAADDEEE